MQLHTHLKKEYSSNCKEAIFFADKSYFLQSLLRALWMLLALPFLQSSGGYIVCRITLLRVVDTENHRDDFLG